MKFNIGILPMNLFEKPGHILPEGFHGPDAFLVGLHLSDIPAHPQVPVAGPRDDGLIIQKKMIQGIVRMKRPSPPHGNDRRCYLPFEQPPVGTRHRGATLNEAFHVGRDIRNVSRGPEKKSLCLHHFANVIVGLVILYDTLLVLVLGALVTSDATGNPLAG